MAEKYVCKKCNEEIKDATCTVVQTLPIRIDPNYVAPTLSIGASEKDNYSRSMYFHNTCWLILQKQYADDVVSVLSKI